MNETRGRLTSVRAVHPGCRRFARLLLACLALAAALSQAAPAPGQPAPRLLVEYFFTPGCPECREVADTILPVFTNVFAGAIDFKAWDVTVPAHYVRLARLQERLGVRSNEPVAIYVDDAVPLLGVEAIRENLEHVVVERIAAGAAEATDGTGETGEPAETHARDAAAPEVLSERLLAFTVPAVALAGLVDGVNPCAFAAIVFFITLLSVSGVRDARLLMVGAAYVLAVFCTYLAMGFGAFRLLRVLEGWNTAGEVLRWIMTAVLVLLAAVSFRDAWVFQRRGKASEVALQLPDRLKRRMHEVMRRGLRPAHLFFSTLAIGVLVTLIEAVCTGQVYLPTLVVLTGYAETRGRAFPLLLLYNFAFVIPLIVVIAAAFLGVHNPRLLAWSRGNVVWGKALMGLLFVCLAVILWII